MQKMGGGARTIGLSNVGNGASFSAVAAGVRPRIKVLEASVLIEAQFICVDVVHWDVQHVGNGCHHLDKAPRDEEDSDAI